jgi:hypothetical protein
VGQVAVRYQGAEAIDATGAFPLVLPRDNQPEFLALSARTVQPMYELPEASDADFDAFERSLPGGVQTGHTLVTVLEATPAGVTGAGGAGPAHERTSLAWRGACVTAVPSVAPRLPVHPGV